MVTREGQTFGNYQVLARIGSGGMGAVYLAQHPLIGKRVALKVIHKDLATNHEVVSRFFNEARAVNRIGNEHIVEIHDFGQSLEGDHFFVMEHIEGRTLADVLEQEGALHPQRALHIAAQIADALSAAHSCAIIHRDLKPDNVMLTVRMGDPDFVKILDFGLAKVLVESNAANLTAQGVVLGTPQYMAPEVCEGSKPIDYRVDIYSLGILLFQMTTGRLPFDGTSMGAILIKHVTEPPPAPRGLNPAIAPSVEQIILRCLAKSPDARFATMLELRHALLDPDRYLASSPPIMPSTSPVMAALPQPVQPAAQPAPGGAARWSVPPGAWPGMSPPAAPVNQTMYIDPPVGYHSAPPRRTWLLALAISAIAATIGAAVVLLLFSSDQGDAAAGGHDAGAAALAGQPQSDAAPGGHDAAERVQETVTMRLTTRPPGAQVFDESDKLLGETPTEISLPKDGQEHVLVFRHPKARERRKVVVATADAELELELELVEQPKQNVRKRPRRPAEGQRRETPRTKGGKTPRPQGGLITPDF